MPIPQLKSSPYLDNLVTMSLTLPALTVIAFLPHFILFLQETPLRQKLHPFEPIYSVLTEGPDEHHTGECVDT